MYLMQKRLVLLVCGVRTKGREPRFRVCDSASILPSWLKALEKADRGLVVSNSNEAGGAPEQIAGGPSKTL